eukprot:s1_g237.t1
MKGLLGLGVAVTLWLSPQGVAHAEERYCFGDLAGELPSLSLDEKREFLSRWGVVTMAMFYRSLFDLPNERNEEIIRALTESANCQLEGVTGQLMWRKLADGLETVEGMYIDGPEVQGEEAFYQELGQLVSEIPWPSDQAGVDQLVFDKDEAFLAALQRAREFEQAKLQGAGQQPR